MKRLLSTLGIALITCVAWAQNLPQGFGFQIGFAQPVLRLNSPETRYPSDSLVNTTTLNGFKVGLVYDATFVKGFGASIGVNYTFGQGNTQWQRQSTLSDYPQKRIRTTYNQVELFVDWQYKFEIAGGTYIILYSGPSIQCAVAMTDKVLERQLDGGISEKNRYSLLDYRDSEQSRDLKRFNLTWGVGVGFQYQQFFLRGGYDFGLVNPYKETNFNKMGFANDRYTRGRLDQWNLRLGMYLWRN